MKLRSQEVRTLAPENDPLKMGMGWKVEDLGKPQIMVESTFGDSHPGSGHLDKLVEAARRGIAEEGGYGALFLHGHLRRRKPGNGRHQFQPGKPGNHRQHDRDSCERDAI